MPRTVDVTLYHEQFPANRDKHCNRCVLHEGVQNVCVPTVRLKTSLSPTPRTPAVVVVGQNPGQQEDEKGLPFVGPSGALVIHGMIEPALIHTLATVYITNAVRCATEKNATPPMKCQRTCFRAFTLYDLELIADSHHSAPLVLLCLGAPAAATIYREFFGFKKAPSQSDAFALNGRTQRITGPTEHDPSREWVVFSTYHPAYLFRNPNVNTEIEAHMGQLQRFLTGDVPRVAAPTLISPTPP